MTKLNRYRCGSAADVCPTYASRKVDAGWVRTLARTSPGRAAYCLVRTLVPLLLGACTTTPYDFPVPTMVDQEQGVSMTGFMATDQEGVVRERLAKRMNCPAGVDFPVLDTTRADNKLGTKILYYRVVMKCRASQPASPG